MLSRWGGEKDNCGNTQEDLFQNLPTGEIS